MYIKVYVSVLKGYKIGQNKSSIVFPPSCKILLFAKSVDPYIPSVVVSAGFMGELVATPLGTMPQ